MASRLKGVDPNHRAGAVNLLHYVGLRRHDLREVQDRLAVLGLSSLGRAESHVLANLDKVLGLLHRLTGRDWESLSDDEPAGFNTARRLLEQHTDRLLGPSTAHPRRSDHGDLADRGGARLRADACHARRRHGLRAHQLRARRPRCLGGDGGDARARETRSRSALSRADGPRGTEAAHRRHRARPRRAQVAATTRCLRASDCTGPRLPAAGGRRPRAARGRCLPRSGPRVAEGARRGRRDRVHRRARIEARARAGVERGCGPLVRGDADRLSDA